MGTPIDHRKHPRIELILKVEYEKPQDFLADYISNASGGGVFIATTRPFSIGDEIHFNISFPSLLSPIQCRGEVRWRKSSEEATDENPAGIGVAFKFGSEQEARDTHKLLEKLKGAAPAAKTPAESAEEAARPFRVLLAENNAVIREMFAFGLQKFHHTRRPGERELVVVETNDGKAAWDHLQTKNFDLAIVDLDLPILSGEKLIQMIRQSQTSYSTPIIAVSAGTEEAQSAAYSAGADMFLGKPVMLVKLFNSLQMLMNKK